MSRPVLQAWIETLKGLWKTTDTVVTALTPPPILQLRSVQAATDPCAGAETQATMNDCAFQSFLAKRD